MISATNLHKSYGQNHRLKLRQQSSLVFHHYHLFQNKQALDCVNEHV